MMKSFQFNSVSRKIALIGFTTAALTGCSFELPGFLGSSEDQAADQAAAPTDATGSPAAAPAAGQASPAAAQVVRCETPNYYADVAIENGQTVMSFVRKPETAGLSKAPATRTDNPDGSVTFAASGEGTFYSRLYPNATCLLQTVGSNGAVGFEENGQIKR